MDDRNRDPAVEVAVVAPIATTLSYLPPKEGPELATGQRVLVPLGRRKVTGYVITPKQDAPPDRRLKRIISAGDEPPLFPAAMVSFFRFIADYYQFPIGEVIRTALPAGLSRKSRRVLVATGTRTEEPGEGPTWLAELFASGRLSPKKTAAILGQRGERKKIEELVEQGLIEVTEEISGPSGALGRITFVRRSASVEGEKLTRPEARVLELLAADEKDAGMARPALTRLYSGAATGIKRLAARGAVELFEKTIFRDPLIGRELDFPEPDTLTCDQKKVLAEILPAMEGKLYAPFLLHGVTGSGKTEVYLKAAAACLAADREVIVLVPEIALASQLEAHFVSRFGDRVALLHSGLTRAEHMGQWLRIKAGEARITIGARSAVFAPAADPGLIIVDEEHDPAYKQEDGLRYHGRDLAILRASQCRATVIMGSATPAVTTYHKAKSGRFTLLEIPGRISPHPLPEVRIVDLKKVLTVSGRPPLFTPQLRDEIKSNLERGEQSLIFLNRRGYASMVVCRDCGEVVGCRNCQVSLTLHQHSESLICHHCGFRLPQKLICANCASPRLVPLGFGTERIEAKLVRLFPQARIGRLDRDSTADRKHLFSILKKVHEKKIDILIGTQMITKGHDFPGVTLVGVICADTGLGLPDYKAGERTFQLLTQVAGRAGRANLAGRVVIQTLNPEHYALKCARNHDYPTLYENELKLRRHLAFPPFGHLVSLRCEAEEEGLVKKAARALAAKAAELARGTGVKVIGPAPAPIARIQKRFRWHILLKGTNRRHLKELCGKLRGDLPAECRRIKVVVDVDPENML